MVNDLAFSSALGGFEQSVLGRASEQRRRQPQDPNVGVFRGLHVNCNATIMRKRVGDDFELFAVDPNPLGDGVAEMFHPRADFG
jgi:hypothetical protein